MYGPDELRRLAFFQLAGRLGIPLDTAACVLDQPGERWRRDAAGRIADLDDLIRRARGAQSLLQNAIDCPEEHPMTDCTSFTATLDDLVGGKTFDDLAAEHAPDESGAVTRPRAR